jgi:hypothetical protein
VAARGTKQQQEGAGLNGKYGPTPTTNTTSSSSSDSSSSTTGSGLAMGLGGGSGGGIMPAPLCPSLLLDYKALDHLLQQAAEQVGHCYVKV